MSDDRQRCRLRGHGVHHGRDGHCKELAAKAVHQDSARRKAPLIPLNWGGILNRPLKSETFAHMKGALTETCRCAARGPPQEPEFVAMWGYRAPRHSGRPASY
ncbi:sigma 54-interacting transcriptional regulator [Roseococcus sp. SDR]|uniref:sigma 54-interacting transcriptional regulator n=1 Tax=Roseococcus sp. SDR TaxID=2835532 RepID=UPI001BCA8758|nr:sigma 54-interacting transcriptional regulator [Roseococcus sp. SDR]MBV1844607.1 sigma 54-interacting transcriptional regulator [Roseococcus sp. SDR]